MIQAAQEKKFQILLCKSQSRFTRDMELVEKYIHGLFPSGASASSPWQTTPTRRSRATKSPPDQWTHQRVVSGGSVGEHPHGLRHEAAAGAVHRRLSIYGYRKDPDNKGHLLVDPEAAEVVRQIFRWSLEGHGKQSIAHMLNDLGVVNPTRYKAERAGTATTSASRISGSGTRTLYGGFSVMRSTPASWCRAGPKGQLQI